MEKLFIEAKYTGKIAIDKKDIAQLPKNIGLATTVQFVDCLKDIKKQLIGKNVFFDKAKQKHPGQILGCDVSSAEKIKNKVDAFLYIGTGHFHPIALGLLGKEVYILNPFDGRIKKQDKSIIENYQKRKKGAMLKFLNAKNVGFIISTKAGQNYPIKKLELIEKKYKDKKFYYFVADQIDINQLENFKFIESWVNTACPRLEEDFSFVNIKDLN
jgi:2-(3-amino-3-carboxypropyl)histidine synthase